MIRNTTKEKYLNKKYGKLYVKDIYKKDKVNFCICSCECGNENYHIRACDLNKAGSCGCIKSNNGKKYIQLNKEKLENKTFTSNNSGLFKVINYKDKLNVTIQFVDTGFQKIVCVSQIYSGEIKDPYRPLKYGQYIGEGNYKTHNNDKNRTPTFEYNKWSWMLLRCYDENELKKEPTYVECQVCDEWLNFQNFAEWINNNKYECDNLELDKDLLVRGNKIYSPSTCCLLPHEINYAISMCFDKNRHMFLLDKYKNILPNHVTDAYITFINFINEEA